MGVTRHVVMFSGGVGSWAAAKRVVARHGAADVVLLFTDTRIEDADLYRFLREAADDVGAPLVWLQDGRTPWEVFAERRFLGNTRAGICSLVLKREVADAWLAANRDPADTALYLGIDWSESHRLDAAASRYARAGWRVEAPLCEAPYLTRDDLFADLARTGIALPRLYRLGFAHNNCGGGCVKAGVGHFAHLLRTLPDVYGEWERNEQALRDQLGDVAILRDRTGGQTRPLPLATLRARMEAGYQPDLFEIGGCGCFVDSEAVETPAPQPARVSCEHGDWPKHGHYCAWCFPYSTPTGAAA